MQILCAFDDLEENGSKGFELPMHGRTTSIFIVRRGGSVYGYRNVCPHRGTTLDWLPDRFLDPGREYIQCSTHDARFRVEDGFCVAGPCVGRSLAPVEVGVRDGQVVLLDD
jgi:nitrite reductase/ring-hydroxylating ferredoxin subunit